MYVVLLAMTYKQVENNIRSTAINDIQHDIGTCQTQTKVRSCKNVYRK